MVRGDGSEGTTIRHAESQNQWIQLNYSVWLTILWCSCKMTSFWCLLCRILNFTWLIYGDANDELFPCELPARQHDRHRRFNIWIRIRLFTNFCYDTERERRWITVATPKKRLSISVMSDCAGHPMISATSFTRRWFPLTKANNAELWYFLWFAPELTVE